MIFALSKTIKQKSDLLFSVIDFLKLIPI